MSEIINSLVFDIKKKKELKEISSDFVKKELLAYLTQNPKLKPFLEKAHSKSAVYKQIVKEVRAKLRRVYGLFRDDNKERSKLIKELSQGKNVIKEILLTHSSTKERFPFYNELYQKIFTITGKPKTILDLGSGINPFSYFYMKLKKLIYYAYELNQEEVKNINLYFRLLNKNNSDFKGKAQVLDLLKFKTLPEADLAFLFKMTDVLDRGKGHKKTEEVLKKIPAKYLIISFPTITMSNKKMNFPRRKWVELLCERLGYQFEVLEFSNELFYVIKKV